MLAVTSTSSTASPGPSAGSGSSGIVVRPDPGLARGVWEAPPWLFWVFLALIVLGAAAYLLRRLGVLRFGRGRAPNGDDAAPHSRPAPRSRRP